MSVTTSGSSSGITDNHLSTGENLDMATAAPPSQEEAPTELEVLAVKPGSDAPRLLFLLIRFRSRARWSSNGSPSTLLAAQARRD